MRYLVLILLNTPIILLAFLNIVTQYKMHRMPRRRFYGQLLLWVVILAVLIGSFPVYNLSVGRPLLDSTDLSAFDIVEITALIFLFYVVNDQRRKIEHAERRLRDLHQELSIKLSSND
jgi:polyferredoxin